MNLGKHPLSLEKSLQIVRTFNNIKQQIKNATNDKQVEHLSSKLNYTEYAVAREVLLKHGYRWTALYGGK